MDSIAMMFKGRIANMPDDITDKDILAYAKNIIKEIKEENKKKRVPKKRVVKVDEEGNIVRKEPTMYHKFIKDNRERINEQNPELTNTERFAKLIEEWNKYKRERRFLRRLPIKAQ
jgi:ABC-type oligopeptide transport system ATPase subunit